MAWRLIQIHGGDKLNFQHKFPNPSTSFHESSQHRYNLKLPNDKFHTRLLMNCSTSWTAGYGCVQRKKFKGFKIYRRRKKYENGDIVLNNLFPAKTRSLYILSRLLQQLVSKLNSKYYFGFFFCFPATINLSLSRPDFSNSFPFKVQVLFLFFLNAVPFKSNVNG